MDGVPSPRNSLLPRDALGPPTEPTASAANPRPTPPGESTLQPPGTVTAAAAVAAAADGQQTAAPGMSLRSSLRKPAPGSMSFQRPGPSAPAELPGPVSAPDAQALQQQLLQPQLQESQQPEGLGKCLACLSTEGPCEEFCFHELHGCY